MAGTEIGERDVRRRGIVKGGHRVKGAVKGHEAFKILLGLRPQEQNEGFGEQIDNPVCPHADVQPEVFPPDILENAEGLRDVLRDFVPEPLREIPIRSEHLMHRAVFGGDQIMQNHVQGRLGEPLRQLRGALRVSVQTVLNIQYPAEEIISYVERHGCAVVWPTLSTDCNGIRQLVVGWVLSAKRILLPAGSVFVIRQIRHEFPSFMSRSLVFRRRGFFDAHI